MSRAATVDKPSEEEIPARFNSTDRCDACGAQAYIGATVNGTELIYCAHHGKKYAAKLKTMASTWYDETHLLELKR